MSSVYKILAKDTGQFYIGSSKDSKKRFKRHLKELKEKKHYNKNFQSYYDSNGADNLELIILKDNITRSEAYEEEDRLLKLYSKNDLLINIAINSRFGNVLSRHPDRKRIIQKITDSIIERSKNFTEEDHKKMSEKTSGKNNGNYKTGKYVNIIHYCDICGKELKTPGATRCISCRQKLRTGNKNSFFGKHHTKETLDKIKKTKSTLPKVLPNNSIKCSVDNVIYESYADAGRKLGIPLSTVKHRCLSKKFPNYIKII